MRWRWILWDLDGTLSDPGPGITASIRFALERLGYPVPSPGELSWAVGPSLRDSFARLAGTQDPAVLDRLVAAYRERFIPTGMFENTVYPGISDALAECAAAGQVLALATLKPAVFARRILRHFGLCAHFRRVVGSYLDGRRGTKLQVVAEALRLLGADPRSAVMIGDRAADLEAAAACGMDAIGAGWGYAARGELEGAHPMAVCGSVGELRWVLGEGR